MKLSTECLEASQVDSLLQGNLTPEEYEAAQDHLELCETCRARVEATIGPEQWWSDVQSVLLNSRTGSFSQRNASSTDADPNEPSTTKLLDLLGPTDDPNMLGRISLKPVAGNDPRLFQVVDSRITGAEIEFGMYKVVGDKLTILLTQDAPPKLLAPTEGEWYFECHRPASDLDQAMLDAIDMNPDQIKVLDGKPEDAEHPVSAKEETTAPGKVSGTEKPGTETTDKAGTT